MSHVRGTASTGRRPLYAGSRSSSGGSSKFAQGLNRHLSFSRLSTTASSSTLSAAPKQQQHSHGLKATASAHQLRRYADADSVRSAPLHGRSSAATAGAAASLRPRTASAAAGPPPGGLQSWRSSRTRENAWVTPGRRASKPAPPRTAGAASSSRGASSRSPERSSSASASASSSSTSMATVARQAKRAQAARNSGGGGGGSGGGGSDTLALPSSKLSEAALSILRNRLVACLAELRAAQTHPGDGDAASTTSSSSSDSEGSPSAKPQTPAGNGDNGEVDRERMVLKALKHETAPGKHIPHLTLILRVLKRAARASSKLQKLAEENAEVKEREADARARVEVLEADLDVMATRAKGEHHNRVVVVDQTPFPQGGGAARAAVEAENIIRGLRSELAAMQAQHATAMAAQAEELEQLRAAVSTSLDLQNLTEELANLRHHSDALRRDVRQARALAQETEEQKSAVEKRAQTLMSTLDEKRSEQAKLQRLVDRATRRMANRSDQLATVVARMTGMDAASPAKPSGGKAGSTAEQLEALERERGGLAKENELLNAQAARLRKENDDLAAKLDAEKLSASAASDAAARELKALKARLEEQTNQHDAHVQEAVEKATKKAAAQATSDAATIATLEQQLADATKLSTLQAARLTAMQREQEVLQETERSMADALRNMDAKIDSLSDELHQARSKAKESEVEVQQHGEARRDREIESARQEQQLEAARAEIEELRAKVQQAKRDGLTRAAQLSARLAVSAAQCATAKTSAKKGIARADEAEAAQRKLESALSTLRKDLSATNAARLRAEEQLQATRAELAEQREATMAANARVEAALRETNKARSEVVALRDAVREEHAGQQVAHADRKAAIERAEASEKQAAASTNLVVELRKQVAELQEEARSSQGGRVSPDKIKQRTSHAKSEGIKAGKASSAKQVALLSAQLNEAHANIAKLQAELEAGGGGGGGGGGGSSTPRSFARSPSMRSLPRTPRTPGAGAASPKGTPRHSKTASAGWLEATHGMRRLLLDTKAKTLLQADADVTERRTQVERMTSRVREQEAKVKEQRAFLNKWAAELAEKDRTVTARLQDLQGTTRKLARQRLEAEAKELKSSKAGAGAGAAGSGGDSVTPAEREELNRERAIVAKMRGLLQQASAVMKKRLTLQTELLSLTPVLAAGNAASKDVQWRRARSKADMLQSELSEKHEQFATLQRQLDSLDRANPSAAAALTADSSAELRAVTQRVAALQERCRALEGRLRAANLPV